jgi:hypothetical protein
VNFEKMLVQDEFEQPYISKNEENYEVLNTHLLL